MTVDPRITAILEARKQAGIVITKTVTPASIPATPPARTGGSIGSMNGQSVGAPSPTSPPVPVEVPVPDAELAVILGDVISAGDALVRKLIAALGDRKLSVREALALAPDIRNLISLAVSQAAPAIKGSSARDLVLLILPAFIIKYVTPFFPAWVPAWARAWITAPNIAMAAKGLEYAYKTWVAPKIGKK